MVVHPPRAVNTVVVIFVSGLRCLLGVVTPLPRFRE
jgi:hypothetical protein